MIKYTTLLLLFIGLTLNLYADNKDNHTIFSETGTKFDGIITKGTKQLGHGVFTANNIKNANGELRYDSTGIKYIGEFKDNLIHGIGKMTFSNGNKYAGEFKEGNMHGHCTYTFSDREYVGEFKRGFNGQGTLIFNDGAKMSGVFKNHKLNGHGEWLHPKGHQYIGDFKDNIYHGNGTLISSNGDKYIGDFKDNKYHGNGTLILSNGDKYIGDFKDGEILDGHQTIHKNPCDNEEFIILDRDRVYYENSHNWTSSQKEKYRVMKNKCIEYEKSQQEYIADEDSPCLDKMFLTLKEKSLSEMTDREYDYFMMFQKECLNEEKKTNSTYQPKESVRYVENKNNRVNNSQSRNTSSNKSTSNALGQLGNELLNLLNESTKLPEFSTNKNNRRCTYDGELLSTLGMKGRGGITRDRKTATGYKCFKCGRKYSFVE